MESLAFRLAEARKNCGLTQAQVADYTAENERSCDVVIAASLVF